MSEDQITPQPVPPSAVVLSLPKDMYAHRGAPTEWWWHIGTLRAGDRIFGFEINAASFEGQGFAFSQIMLTDIENGKHYERTTPYVPPFHFKPKEWAESDPAKDWYARLGSAKNKLGAIQVTNPGSGYTKPPKVKLSGGGLGGVAVATLDENGGVQQIVVASPGFGYSKLPKVTITGDGTGATAVAVGAYVAMEAPAGDPSQNIHVNALLVDDPTLTEIEFDLTFSQQGRPFFVFGTGLHLIAPDATAETATLENDNFYFSYTRLRASGTITIDGEAIPVEGTTWMDHEYGFFGTSGEPVKWILQDMQLDNGVTISNFGITAGGLKPEIGVPFAGSATVQTENGDTFFVDSTLTPTGRTWTSDRSGSTYFTEIRVEIPSFGAEILITTRFDSQEFALPAGSVYEGIAHAEGAFQGMSVTGDAWLEQTA